MGGEDEGVGVVVQMMLARAADIVAKRVEARTRRKKR